MPTLRRGTGEKGQVTPLMALFLVAAAGAAILLGSLGGLVNDRARARAAADAAALAGAVEGRDGASRVALANGGTLEAFTSSPAGEVEVTVLVRSARASARAALGPATKR